MNKSEFLKDMEDILQREDVCHETDELDVYDEWDSLAKMSMIAYFDRQFNLKVSLNELKKINKVADLIRLAGDNIND